MTLLWSWFADFLTPALTLPAVALDESKTGNDFPFWLLVSLGIAVAGWVYAYATQTRTQKKPLRKNNRSRRWYVLFLFETSEPLTEEEVSKTAATAQLEDRLVELNLKAEHQLEH